MVQYQLKLKLTPRQERQLNHWLFHLTAVWNWAIKKIENDARDGIFYSRKDFQNLLADHSIKLGIASHTLQGVLSDAHIAWSRSFKKIARKPRLKGRRNKLNSIPFPDPFRLPRDARIAIPGLGRVRYHKQKLPDGKIKCGRIVKRASGWYLCLLINTDMSIPAIASGAIGIDPGFKSLLVFSTGEKIEHPRELEASALRLAQSDRGKDRRLTARIHERIANQRKDRNHKLSRRLVSENAFIAFSKDNIRGIQRRFGKSVASSGHYQIRLMLAYKSKCRTDGLGIYVEPKSKNSTRTCSACGALSGPTGWTGLSVRLWKCSACGAEHDRDINAAINTLHVGAGLAHETLVRAA